MKTVALTQAPIAALSAAVPKVARSSRGEGNGGVTEQGERAGALLQGPPASSSLRLGRPRFGGAQLVRRRAGQPSAWRWRGSFSGAVAVASMRPAFPPPPAPLRDVCVELSPLRLPGPESGPGMGVSGGPGGGGAFFPERLRLPICCLGVFVCYFWYGVLQETITRGKYGEGEKQEKFRYALSLVFIQCVINAIFARLLIQFFDTVKVDRTQNWLYAACSLSYLGAMVSSNSALQFVNYPTQVLGKSCKPIPVMLLGVTVLRKKYPLSKYLCVLLIVTGVALFMYKPKKGEGSDHVFGYGELLLLLSLTLDGLTGVSQDHMRAHYQTGANHMMLNVNLWSTLFLGAGILFTGELWDFLSFTERYPSIIYNILLFGLTSALGQSFIFMTVVYFGPLTCSIVTTTRKFFTILASVILFANPITNLQWVGTILVFLGLGLDAKFGKTSKKTSH